MDVKTAARVLDLFEMFTQEPRPLRLTDIARLLDAPASSCHQLIRTLERRGYIYSPYPRAYFPTQRMLRNANAIDAHDPLLTAMRPSLEELRDRTGESVLVGQQSGIHVLVLEVVESNQSIRYAAPPGGLRYMHCSGMGKALLAQMDSALRNAVLPPQPFPRLTPRTLTARQALDADLQAGIQRGWHASVEEGIADLSAVAVPLRLAGTTFALSVAGPASRFNPAQHMHAVTLMAAAGRIEQLTAPVGTPGPAAGKPPHPGRTRLRQAGAASPSSG